MEGSSKKLSVVLDCIKVPLFILIVFIHNSNTVEEIPGVVLGANTNMPFYYYVSEYFSEVIARIAVPCFFFISGYLFYGNKEFTKEVFFNKLKKRVHSLLIPYVIWMSLFIIYCYIIPLYVPQFFSEEGHEITTGNILSTYWATKNGGAVNQLWYIRDLMCCVLISPLFFVLFKKIPIITSCVFFVLCFFDITIPLIGNYGFSNTALFFYGMGFLSAMKKISLVKKISWRGMLCSTVFIFCISILDLLTRECNYNYVIHNSFVMMGLIYFFVLFNYLYDKNHLKWEGWRFLSSASFFVYAFHLPWVITPVRKVLFSVFHFSTDLSLLVSYFLIVILAIIISLLTYSLLLKISPRLVSVISGGRCYKREKV